MTLLQNTPGIRIDVDVDETGRVASVELLSSRPVGVARLFVGRPADEIPALAGSLFSLCGFAHGAAARNAIAAARGEKDASENDVIGLAAERLVELLRASIMDWPSDFLDRGSIAAPLRRAIVAARALMADSSVKRKADDIEAALAACGLRADRGAPKGFFGSMIEEARSEPLGPPHAPDSLTPVDDAAVIRSLRLGRAAFAARPALPGRKVETGAFARHWRESRYEKSMLAARLEARFAGMREALATLREGRPVRPDHSIAAGRVGDREGYAAVETARGRLYHWARLGSDGRILDYEMLAPTEWNFHPEGPFVAALRGAKIGCDESAKQRVARLATVFDPCVAFHVAVNEPCHA